MLKHIYLLRYKDQKRLHADFPGRGSKGKGRYTLNEPLNHGVESFEGTIVQIEYLFVVGDIPLAFVTYGRKGAKDRLTDCYFYTFDFAGRHATHEHRIVHASRLKAYVHFGEKEGRLLLNRFYIP